MTEFFLEIHSEEIPANFQESAAQNLKDLICKSLVELKLKFINPKKFIFLEILEAILTPYILKNLLHYYMKIWDRCYHQRLEI